MEVVHEDVEFVTLKLNPMEVVGFSNSVLLALNFHLSELHTLTALEPEEARRLLDELRSPIDRMRERRLQAGLTW